MKPVRILVTGSRDWTNFGPIFDALSETNERFRDEEADEYVPLVVVHGACNMYLQGERWRYKNDTPTGVDALAHFWATMDEYGISKVTAEPHPADWTRGKSEGPARNQRMVDLGADLCLAFIGPCTKEGCTRGAPGHGSHGATHCADRAEAAGIETVRIYG